jgi:hypothetical protein
MVQLLPHAGLLPSARSGRSGEQLVGKALGLE